MTIDGIAVRLAGATTVYDAASRAGIRIPVLCHREGLHPTGSCGICTVEDSVSGRLLPACATPPHDAMSILTASPAALRARRDAVELLLSNHPADCEAPCQLACPSGLPVPQMLEAITEGHWPEASRLARDYPITCGDDAPCEKACRRRPMGGAVAICVLHRWLSGATPQTATDRLPPPVPPPARFRSRMPRPDETMMRALSAEPGPRRAPADTTTTGLTRDGASYEAMRCMQCGCRKPDNCRLRELCEENSARQSAYAGEYGSMTRGRAGAFRFDAARCVLCGICVRTAQSRQASIAPTFQGRGFAARIAPPLGRTWSEIPSEILSACAEACPTGAMSLATSADREEQKDADRPERV
ncbi:MAG TPA: 2Fe-2S iron-sulfur cluster-binding protein [Kiritimatiellia bacterium]|nr:2Fe-2S iron-sulfur cluster-binding protein [Kiritimatiellia bacterium]HRU70436.1 2Fe-2S iron-sulfur cluster-binding protein [Kiritimatiellia bacterium]